jgi:uncharacterized protein (DUF697 family)
MADDLHDDAREPKAESAEATPADQEADSIIRKHMLLSMAGGAIPVPVLDLAAVTAVQLDMLKQLAKAYDRTFDSRSARAFVTSITTALAGTMLARLGASLIKFVPGVGWAAGGVTQAVITGGTTYAVGGLFKRLFREDRPFTEVDVDLVKDELNSYFEAGQKLARKLADTIVGK